MKSRLLVKEADGVFEVEGAVEWKYIHDKASGDWIAVCDLLGLTVSAESPDELRLNIVDAMNLLFESLQKEGDLSAFLTARGWAPMDKAQATQSHRISSLKFDVPFQLNRASRIEDLNLAHCG